MEKARALMNPADIREHEVYNAAVRKVR